MCIAPAPEADNIPRPCCKPLADAYAALMDAAKDASMMWLLSFAPPAARIRDRVTMTFDLEPQRSEQFVALQHLVQRKLGRCLIRLQQYERLLKALVAEHDVSGPAHQLIDIRDSRMEALSKKTLGHVVGAVTENLLTPDSIASDEDGDNDHSAEEDAFVFCTRFRVELSAKRHEETVTALRALVDLRNELVHHFLEKHDIWSESGCITAQAYLEACYEQVDERYMELQSWAKASVEAREYMANFMQTPEFRGFLHHGILPGGAVVEWACSTIVRLLREAEAGLARDGWTSLNDAIAFLQKAYPEHTPRRYGCSSWRQVLHESGQFQVRKEQAGPGSPTRVWFRSEGT